MKKCIIGSSKLEDYLLNHPDNRRAWVGKNPTMYYFQASSGQWMASSTLQDMKVVTFEEYFDTKLSIDRKWLIDYGNATDEELTQVITILSHFGESILMKVVNDVNAKKGNSYNYKSLRFSSTSKRWSRTYETPTISAKEFIAKYSQTTTPEKMETTTPTAVKPFNQTAFFTEGKEFKILWSNVRTQRGTIAKEVFLTRTLKVGEVERDVSLAVIIDEDWSLHVGYSVRNPKFDKVNNTEIAKRVARNRAIHPRTNLLRNESITPELVSKQVLRGIADMVFAKIIKGEIEIKGIK